MTKKNKIDYEKLVRLSSELEDLLNEFEKLLVDVQNEESEIFADLVYSLSKSWVDLDQFVYDHRNLE